MKSTAFGPTDSSPVNVEGRPSALMLREMVAAEQQALAEARAKWGPFSRTAATPSPPHLSAPVELCTQ